MNSLVLLATGFEEVEAVGTIDILRRGNIKTVTASVTGQETVVGAHGIPVVADTLFENIDLNDFESIVLPGGGPGSLMLKAHEAVREAIVDFHAKGKLIAAICASPRVFGSLGLLQGKKATCYPGIEPELTGAEIVNAPTVIDGNIITGRGPGLVFDFGLAIIDYIYKNNSVGFEVAKDLLLIND
ncbi:MAG: DJ-1/PfpI family protein [Tannerella sp.]|jgi:4-methyl-5(b-hydroxyethyl)-thiazole monophosphate biosynthesis|nr:DJ-1/PfpI family protein [Tannerella sp.]